MSNKITKLIRSIVLSSFALVLAVTSVSAEQVNFVASGADSGALTGQIVGLRLAIGGANNGVGGSYTSGRREIDWEVTENFASPNNFVNTYYNFISPRGLILDGGYSSGSLRVSAGIGNQNNMPLRFGEIDQSYTAMFKTYSGQRLLAGTGNANSDDPHFIEVSFVIPGSTIPATVKGFGVVFTDVDAIGNAVVKCFGADGRELGFSVAATPANNGLSFVGIAFNEGERIAKVRIVSGDRELAQGNTDGGGRDMIAMDDFIYGEPRAMQYHASDFDGDGTSDVSVFRPSTGQWFMMNSGSNTFSGVQFGQAGDVPVEGDFDGDSRSDVAVFRPADGGWYRLNSSTGEFAGAQFGQAGDKPVPGDYDRDGKTDIAVWRPSNGFYYQLRSSNGQFQATQFGQNGDIPLQSALNP